MRLVRYSLILMIAAALCSLARGDAPPDKFAGPIKEYLDSAAARQSDLGDMLGLAQQMPGFTKGDIALITAYMQEEIDAWKSAASALQKGDQHTADGFVRHAQDMQGWNGLWNERLYARQRQSQQNEHPASYEWEFDAMVEDHQHVDIKEIAALMEAKKRLSEAYGRLADATIPKVETQTLFKLKDQIWDVETEMEVANMKLIWARDDRPGWTTNVIAPSNITPELQLAKQRVAEWRQQYEQSYRQKRASELAMEKQRRAYDDLLRDFDRKFDAAEQAARNRAKQN